MNKHQRQAKREYDMLAKLELWLEAEQTKARTWETECAAKRNWASAFSHEVEADTFEKVLHKVRIAMDRAEDQFNPEAGL